MSTPGFVQEKNILELIYLESGKIRLYFYQSSQTGPLRNRDGTEIAMDRIERAVEKIKNDLDRFNNFKTDPGQFIHFKKSCYLLYDELLSRDIKEALQNTTLRNLELKLDVNLIHIPWEWLFDGEQFLCERFNMGRQIQTRVNRKNGPDYALPIPPPLNMLIITDPTEDLAMSQKEGEEIKAVLGPSGRVIECEIHSGDQVDTDFVRKYLRDYHLVHYAGHVIHEENQPEKSAWLLSDGRFSGSDIEKMAGGQMAMPPLVFCNACKSAATSPKMHFLDEGLIESFLKAGVQNYIGTFCITSDEYGMYMGKEFYSHLMTGHTVAEALRKARVSFQQKYGQESLSWLNYVFYGDPALYLIELSQKDPKDSNEKEGDKKSALAPVKEPIHTRNPINISKRVYTLKPFLIALIVLICLGGLIFCMGKEWEWVPWDIGDNADGINMPQEERIEILKGKIREKLLQRIPEGKASSRDRARPFVVVVFNIFNEKKSTAPGWAASMLKGLTRKIIINFTKDPQLELGEREKLDKLLEEMDLDLSVLPWDNPDSLNLFGKFLYARAMLFLDICKEPEGIFLYYRLVDVKTALVKYAGDDIEFVKEASVSDLAEKVYHRTQKAIYDVYLYPNKK
ncbi:MAG: CHAT domain-containing protein [bacterium]